MHDISVSFALPVWGRDKETRRLYALKMQQRPLPSNTVELTYNEITIQAQTGEGHINM